jgi:Flp pilus assembly protein TadD
MSSSERSGDRNLTMKRHFGVFAAIVLPCACVTVFGQIASRAQAGSGLSPDRQSIANAGATDSQAEQELQKGTALTRDGHFTEAIPHLKLARGRVANEYAVSFNLALCYVATGIYKNAISVLKDLQAAGHDTIEVQNLLAQAYIGSGQLNEAWSAFERAAAKSPQNETLYVFVADACTDYQDFELGLRVVNLGLRNLPQSARLEYQRGMFLTQLDRFDQAKPDFELAAKLAPEGEIGYLSRAEKNVLAGDIPGALVAAREGIATGFQDPALLTVLGAALLRSGITPGQPEFSEAQSALERSVAERPNDAASQISLGEIYLQAGRLDDAIVHLEKARQMKPNQPAVYANLAKAYQRRGDPQLAQQALDTLQNLNRARADQIRNAPGERKMSYGGESGDRTPK